MFRNVFIFRNMFRNVASRPQAVSKYMIQLIQI